MTAPPDVVVIGGGFAGLSAAAALAARGVRVHVLDARPQLGGRATAFTDRETGELVDNGQHVLFGCYRATFEFLARIDALDNVRVQPSLEVPYLDAGGGRSVLRCPPLPSPLHLLAAVLDWDAIPWGDRLAALKLAGPLRQARRDLRRSGTVTADPAGTVTEWLVAHGQRDTLRAWLWDPLAVAALNQSPERRLGGAVSARPRGDVRAGSGGVGAGAADAAAAPDVRRAGARLHRGERGGRARQRAGAGRR